MPLHLAVPANQAYTQKYWLAKPPTADVYQSRRPAAHRAARHSAGCRKCACMLTVDGAPIELLRPVQHRYADRAQGERVRPVVVVPAVAVNLPVPVAVFPDAAPRKVQVSVQANMPNAEGELRLDLPAGWKADARHHAVQDRRLRRGAAR